MTRKSIEKERQRLIDSAYKFEERSGKQTTREDIEARLEIIREYINLPKEIKGDIKIENIILGYLKIAIGFCCLHGKGQDIQKDIFDIFKKYCEMVICEKAIEPADIVDTLRGFLRLIDNKPIKECDDKIYHYICLVGDKKHKKLFCVVSLFEYIELAFILNDNYESESFHEEYVFDLETSSTCNDDMDFSYEDIMSNTFDFNILKRCSNVNLSKKQAPLCRLFGVPYMNYLYR